MHIQRMLSVFTIISIMGTTEFTHNVFHFHKIMRMDNMSTLQEPFCAAFRKMATGTCHRLKCTNGVALQQARGPLATPRKMWPFAFHQKRAPLANQIKQARGCVSQQMGVRCLSNMQAVSPHADAKKNDFLRANASPLAVLQRTVLLRHQTKISPRLAPLSTRYGRASKERPNLDQTFGVTLRTPHGRGRTFDQRNGIAIGTLCAHHANKVELLAPEKETRHRWSVL